MRLIIAGGRDYDLNMADLERLDHLLSVVKITEVVSGGASGVDLCGETWARMRGLPITRMWISKRSWEYYGSAAGPKRNRDMARYADAVVLFPGGKGTTSMFNEARKAELVIFDWRNDEQLQLLPALDPGELARSPGTGEPGVHPGADPVSLRPWLGLQQVAGHGAGAELPVRVRESQPKRDRRFAGGGAQ